MWFLFIHGLNFPFHTIFMVRNSYPTDRRVVRNRTTLTWAAFFSYKSRRWILPHFWSSAGFFLLILSSPNWVVLGSLLTHYTVLQASVYPLPSAISYASHSLRPKPCQPLLLIYKTVLWLILALSTGAGTHRSLETRVFTRGMWRVMCWY